MMLGDLIRYIAALLASGALAVWTANTCVLWPSHDWHTRRVSLAVSSLLLFLAYGFGTAAGRHDPLHSSTVLLALALLLLLGCLLWGRKRSLAAQLARHR